MSLLCGLCGKVAPPAAKVGDECARPDCTNEANAGRIVPSSYFGPFSVSPSRVRALSPGFRRELAAWQARVRESEARSAKRTPTLAELCPAVADRNDRLWQWANAVDWRKAKRDAAKSAALTMVCPVRQRQIARDETKAAAPTMVPPVRRRLVAGKAA